MIPPVIFIPVTFSVLVHPESIEYFHSRWSWYIFVFEIQLHYQEKTIKVIWMSTDYLYLRTVCCRNTSIICMTILTCKTSFKPKNSYFWNNFCFIDLKCCNLSAMHKILQRMQTSEDINVHVTDKTDMAGCVADDQWITMYGIHCSSVPSNRYNMTGA